MEKTWIWIPLSVPTSQTCVNMDILKIFNDKVKEIGLEQVANALGIPKGIAKQFASGKKTPGYKSCQEIINLWGNGQDKDADAGLKELMGLAEPDLWEGRDVCLCLPWYKETYPDTVMCIMAMWDKSRMRLELRSGDSMITRSRNQLAKRFLDTGAAWSVWFDDDMVFPFGHAGIYQTMTNMKNVPHKFLEINTIERLISRGKTVVGGCYWDRRGGGKLIAGGNQPILNPIPSDNLQAVAFVGTGCLAVHRQVFLDVAAKFPETLSPDSLGNECGFFTNIQTPQRMMGEDESFAKRATDAGHPSYLDLAICCGHIGSNIHALPLGGSKI